ncbi:MAG: penicillin-binding protein 1A [Alphaproteobacteria bacterium]|nr:penicillin-binding protein 1A [Alphaproteobacteria bacterium]
MFRLLGFFFGLTLLGAVLAGAGAVAAFWHYGRNLPDFRQLATYELPTSTRVHAADGRLLAEFATEHRAFVPLSVIPKRVIQAFLAAEDDSFFEHPGVDAMSVVRAAVTNLANLGQNRRPVGASTITQQVAKNFLLGSEVSIERKIKEAILAFRMERWLSKERILELYLNEIYLGFGSYGVAAASLNYFNKPLDSLTLGETAFLAALPKGPNNYHPIRRPEAAKARRDWVLGRMVEERFTAAADANAAMREPVRVARRDEEEVVHAPYFSEEVRRLLYRLYGEKGLYEGGLSVRTTLDSTLQGAGEQALRNGLFAYDRRHGFRGPVARIPLSADWATQLSAVAQPKGSAPWLLAAVLDVNDHGAIVGLANGRRGTISNDELAWARRWLPGEKLGPKIRNAREVLTPGDVVLVETTADAGIFALRQVPEVQGALVALDPHTGRILAMVGGYSFDQSQFNRVTQAQRQPGSAFKPFVYIAALENGFTPSSRVLDAPFVIDQGPGLPKWKPANYTNRFYGPSTLRLGIEKSRNLMTVRLAQFLGMEVVSDYAARFGVSPNLPNQLSMALGAGETTLLQLTAGYAMFVNGGKRIEPTLIDRIQDRRGATVLRHDQRECTSCQARWSTATTSEPQLPDNRAQVVSPEAAYQMVSMLQGVVDRGTGARIRELGRPLAGKTGTTNDSNDAWFIGFSPDLAVGIFVGFDQPRSLGANEQGASVAVPVFRDFMMSALVEQPKTPFRIPKGVRLVRVDSESGLKAKPGDQHVILEAFRPGTEPTSGTPVLDSADSFRLGGGDTGSGTGGLY